MSILAETEQPHMLRKHVFLIVFALKISMKCDILAPLIHVRKVAAL